MVRKQGSGSQASQHETETIDSCSCTPGTCPQDDKVTACLPYAPKAVAKEGGAKKVLYDEQRSALLFFVFLQPTHTQPSACHTPAPANFPVHVHDPTHCTRAQLTGTRRRDTVERAAGFWSGAPLLRQYPHVFLSSFFHDDECLHATHPLPYLHTGKAAFASTYERRGSSAPCVCFGEGEWRLSCLDQKRPRVCEGGR